MPNNPLSIDLDAEAGAELVSEYFDSNATTRATTPMQAVVPQATNETERPASLVTQGVASPLTPQQKEKTICGC